MDKFADYKLQLVGLPVGNQAFNYIVGTEFFEEMESSDIRSGLVDVALNVKNSLNCYILDFTVRGKVQILCDRCLEEMDHEVESEYRLTVKRGDEYGEEDDDIIILPKDERELDLSPFIYDTIELSIPIRHVHAEGECNSTMADTLKRLSGEEKETETNDPRWDALRNLLDNK